MGKNLDFCKSVTSHISVVSMVTIYFYVEDSFTRVSQEVCKLSLDYYIIRNMSAITYLTITYFSIVICVTHFRIQPFEIKDSPVSRQIVRLQQIVCHCMILEVSTE